MATVEADASIAGSGFFIVIPTAPCRLVFRRFFEQRSAGVRNSEEIPQHSLQTVDGIFKERAKPLV